MTTHKQFARDAAETGKRLDLVNAIEFTLESHGRLIERDSPDDGKEVGCTWTTSSAAPPLPSGTEGRLQAAP
jgi:hypothetical protein